MGMSLAMRAYSVLCPSSPSWKEEGVYYRQISSKRFLVQMCLKRQLSFVPKPSQKPWKNCKACIRKLANRDAVFPVEDVNPVQIKRKLGGGAHGHRVRRVQRRNHRLIAHHQVRRILGPQLLQHV